MAVMNTKARSLLGLVILYFFFNSIFLPAGLLYTDIFTPVWMWWIYKNGHLHWIGWFFIVTVPFIPIHLTGGVAGWYYLRSYILLFCSVVFGIGFISLLKKQYDFNLLFRQILRLNFWVTVIAVMILPFKEARGVLWYLNEFSPGVGIVPRLKMLTYEASYYSLLFAPVAIYFYLQLLLKKNKNPWAIFIMATIPLMVSLSLGVIGGIALTLIILLCCQSRVFLREPSRIKFIFSGVIIGMAGLICLFIYAPHNPLFGRIKNIFSGNDTSFRGRTYESFILAWKIAKQKSVLFGCGPGQPKIVGIAVFKQYYGYLPDVVRLPNTLADTLATYGMVGMVGRIGLVIYLFFRTRVIRNYYQLSLFIFMFIYQFTGSFFTNIVEYVIWILAFIPVFKQFDRKVLLTEIRSARGARSYRKVNTT